MKTQFGKSIIFVVILINWFTSDNADADLIAHWKLDETSGNIAIDSSGNGHTGTLHGGPVWIAGKVNGALQFDGQDDYVDLPIGSVISSLTNSTFATWVCFNNTGSNWPRIFDFGSSITNYMYLTPCINAVGPMRFTISTRGTKNKVTTLETLPSGWHHVAVTFDADNDTISLYVDGRIAAENANSSLRPSDLGNTTQHWLGQSRFKEDAYFNGFLDDFRIYNDAMNAGDIILLYCQSFVPTSQTLPQIVQDAHVILKDQGPEKALKFIEGEIVEHNQWTKTDENGLAQKLLSSELYFLLAKAEEAAGLSKEDVVTAYERAVASGGLFPPRLGVVLMWLYENVNAEDYGNIVVSLIENDCDYLKEVAARAKLMIHEQKYKEAIRFIKANLNPYLSWQKEHQYVEVTSRQILPEVYFQLAKAQEAIGASIYEVADSYIGTLNPSQSDYTAEWIAAFIWLEENNYTDACEEAIELFIEDQSTSESFKNVVSQVCNYFESEKEWIKFERFLDILFEKTVYPAEWGVFIKSCHNSQTNRWAKAYDTYIDSKPELKFGMDCIIAKKYLSEKKFNEAAGLYRNIISRSRGEKNKEIYEIQLCQCLFECGQYREAIILLDSFITTYKPIHGDLVKEAMLMKGYAHIQLGELEKAIDSFSTMKINYPKTDKYPEVNFLIGYCYKLQDKLKEATEVFSFVAKSYPESSYANKARLCLSQIISATE